MAINQIAIRNSEGNFENLFPLAINKGGTGATNATVARNNLGAAASSHSHSWSSITNKPSALTYMPVGYVYISWSSTSPATLFGGSWTAITGRFPYFNAGTGTGGSNSHTHIETIGWNNGEPLYITQGAGFTGASVISVSKHFKIYEGSNTETNQNARLDHTSSASTMPAYQTFYAWRRTS